MQDALMEENGRIISFVDGMVTDLPDLTDEMYEKIYGKGRI